MTGVNQQQLDGLGSRFDKGFDEIKILMRSFDERVRSVELREASCSPLLVARITETEKKLAAQKEEISDLRKLIETQAKTAETLDHAVKTISGWGKWAARIATALITSGLLFVIGRLVYLSIIGTIP